MNYDQIELKIDATQRRLELEVEGHVAFIEYKLARQILFLIHTEVPSALQGKGAGSALVQKALQYARDNHYKIVPICGFVQSYLERHKEWSDLIAPDADRFIHKH